MGTDSTGTVTVTGASSTWNLGGAILGVGYEGNGTLNIEDGGTVESGAGVVGYNAGSSGTATVTGAESLWNTGIEYLYVGQFGSGTLTIEDGGEVSSAKTFIGNEANSSGTLNLDGDADGRGVLATGKVVKGAGTATLNFNGGVLKATDDEVDFLSGFAAGDIQIEAGGAFIDTNGHDVEADATLQGVGALTKQGAGTLTLTGDSSMFDGSTQVLAGVLSVSSDNGTSAGVLGGAVSVFSGGTLQVEGGTLTGLVTLENGGLLGGNGTIGGLAVKAGGVVAPGNSPGTLAVNGAVTFSDGATYRVDTAADGQHDLIAATGTITLSGGASVEVLAAPGAYDWHTTYTILSTEATVDGTFGTVTSDYAFLVPLLSYDSQNVYLTLFNSDVPFASFARTPNQAGVAVAAQALGLGNEVYDAILGLPERAVAGAYNALSGEVYASAATVIQQQSVYVREAVGARLRQSVTAPAAGPLAYAVAAPATARLGVDYAPTLWAQGYGGWGDTSGNSDVASVSNTIGGFLMGADVAVADNARAGLFGGYSRSTFNVDARSSSGDIDNYDLGLYAGARFDALAVSGGLAYSWHDATVDRMAVFPGFAEALNADYSNGSLQLFGELGYSMTFGAVEMEPFVGAAYLSIDGARFNETGGAAALAVSTNSMETTYTTVGLRVATTVEVQGHVLTPNLTLGWQHAFGDTTPAATMMFSAGDLPFQVGGVPIAEDSMLLQAGIGYTLSDMAVLSASYSGQYASSASQSAFTAQFALKF
ncbi:autotransporter outer membrane beta-barrel domain-containing protein [Ancylobacter polymorphus]|uniref:Outer membrane autotransporter protein n=1 Tax=Ancylobacter polymorphus TaxID=223390 RepID=A0ABU0B724_9HYPH|nr:autotransporter domain-containing protein [Ancylobacter polymorphus]MDQ0301180.1 outer membrane autotransporter protein [Ancylobacter polymorphus]